MSVSDEREQLIVCDNSRLHVIIFVSILGYIILVEGARERETDREELIVCVTILDYTSSFS